MRISELGRRVGVDPPTIRYYESVQVLPEPARTPAGYRDYDEEDADRLRFVSLARSLGLSMGDIREVLALRDRGEPPCGYVRRVLTEQADAIEQRILELQRLQAEVQRLTQVAATLPDTPADAPYVCDIVQHASEPVPPGDKA
ncbi:MAG: heavy metal-responsive transcriptional regulator [Acidimicrobiia bacterium]